MEQQMISVLFIGDVVGRPGRRVLREHLAELRRKYLLDVVIANVENAAAGFGVTRKIVDELFDLGVDVMTSGNHIWDKRETLDFIDHEPRLLRPLNYPPGTPGDGCYMFGLDNGKQLAIINLMGNVFMHPALDCPFRGIDTTLRDVSVRTRAIIVDFHAEASSEKMAMAWHLDGRVSAVVGTHTHIPTADERILPQGCAALSDVGMTGCYASVIGMDPDLSVQRFINKLPMRFQVANGKASLKGVLLRIDSVSGRALHIERINREEA
jgi:metallophosphoesterase (TIGR00282 family)